MVDLVIHSKKTVTPEGVKEAFVFIYDGIISEVRDTLPDHLPCELVDVKDNVLMAGVIDPHVHINEPGRTEWEGFDTATKAALAGGITSVVDMPLNSLPVTTTVDALEKKLFAAKNQLHCNCGFWGGVVPGNESQIEGLIKKGVIGFKAFLIHSGIDEFPNVTETDLRKVMPVIAKHQLPLLVHSELCKPGTGTHQSVTGNIKRNQSYINYLFSRPRKWEDDAIAMMIRLCEEFNCHVHIVHLSSSGSIDQIRKAKQKKLPLTVETAPHYLYFQAEEIEDGQTQFKCAPPIREKENNVKLWEGLKDEVIDFIATDHSPAPPALKQLQTGDFIHAWGGIASLQFSLPVTWTLAKKRSGSLPDVAKWLCEKPAKLVGQQNKKGKIAQGYDADLIVWDEEKSFTVTENIIQHKHKVTPYLNEQLYGVINQTFISGTKVFDDNSFKQLNKGQFIYSCYE